MTTTNNLRQLLNRKAWEICTPAPATSTAGSFIVSSGSIAQHQLYITSGTAHYAYDPFTDGWITLPSSSIAGTFGAGSCGCWHSHGPTGTATSGTTTTITTSLNLPTSLALPTLLQSGIGYKIRLTGGTGAGQERTITGNTVGANSVISVYPAFSPEPDNTTTFLLLTGRAYFWNAGTSSAFGFRYYDRATLSWSSALNTTLSGVTTWGTDGKMVATCSGYDGYFATGTASSATATSLVDSTKTWTSNQWTNFQVRITSGTGVGQVRVITGNNTTSVTVAAWSVNPSSDSKYVIEGDDNSIYLLGNNAVTMYKYSISGNSWSTLSPGVARSATPSTGMSAAWINQIVDPLWNNESANLNGRYIYSFRGGATSALDVYDIAANSWSVKTYAPAAETFTTGTSFQYDGNSIYIQKDATGRFFEYIVNVNTLRPFSTLGFTQGTALVGDRLFLGYYLDGTTLIKWLYQVRNTGAELFRTIII